MATTVHFGSSSQLDQFLILARGQSGLALQKLVLDVLENKQVYVFGELLAESSVQQLQNTAEQPSSDPVEEAQDEEVDVSLDEMKDQEESVSDETENQE